MILALLSPVASVMATRTATECVLLPAMQTFARVRLKAVEDEVERKMAELFAAMMSSRPESAPGIPPEPEPGTTGAEE